MTISNKRLSEEKREAYNQGRINGYREGKEHVTEEMQNIRKQGIIELTRAAAELAQANAKLTYAMSQIANKLL